MDRRVRLMALGIELNGKLCDCIGFAVNELNDALVDAKIDDLLELKKWLDGEYDSLKAYDV